MATVRILRSTTPGAVPASLVSGQLAINEADAKLFFRSSSGVVTEFTGAGGGGGGTTEVLEYSSPAAFPSPGTAARIYVSTSTGRMYRFDVAASVYVEIGGRGVSGPDGGSFA